jgi:arabinogalactan endo-1,4-beta-galactosidase
LKDKDGFANLFGSERQQILGGYKATIQGQATAIRDVMEAVAQVPDGRGLGIFYWEPDWIPVEGVGWKTGEGNAWENQAMFGFSGNALASMNVFNLVKPGSGSTYVAATISELYPAQIEMSLGDTLNLPVAVDALFSDDSIRDVPVTWEAVDSSVLEQGGEVTVHGTVSGIDSRATATIIVSTQKNYAQNPGFETGDFTSWTVDGDTGAADISREAANVHKGSYALHYWLGEPFAFTLSQTVTDLPNGTYTLSAWIQGGGGEETLQLFVSDYGGEPVAVDIVNTEWLVWSTPTIPITITDGECSIGLRVVSAGGSWAFFDDVALVMVE